MVRRPTKVAPARRVITPLPPLLDVQANVCSVWLRRSFGFGVAAGTYTAELHAKEIFRYHASIAAAYTQFRIMCINIWFLPDQGTDKSGQYAAMLVDGGENTNTASFNDVMACPGSVMKKIWQVAALGWRPTEPDDRNWSSTQDDATKIICQLKMASSSTNVNMDGNFVMDYHCQLRGHNSNETFRARVLQLLPDLGLEVVHNPSPGSSIDMCD